MKQLWMADAKTMLRAHELIQKVVDKTELDYGRELTQQESDFVVNEVMKEVGAKNLGSTELSKDELIADVINKGYKSILDIGANGKARIIKKKEK